MRASFALAVLLVVCVSSGCAGEESGAAPSARASPAKGGEMQPITSFRDLTDDDRVVAITPSGAVIELDVAVSDPKRALGLMGREEIPRGTGMLFVFPGRSRHSFWMYRCLTDLDIVWLVDDGTVVDVAESVPPCAERPCPSYAPDAPATIVVEVAGGHARELGIVSGARLVFQRAG